MAQTSPGDLEEKGLENNHEAEPDKSPKSARGHGVKTPHWARGEGAHFRGQRGRRVHRHSGEGGLRIRGTAQFLGNNGKMRVSERMRESQRVSYLGR